MTAVIDFSALRAIDLRDFCRRNFGWSFNSGGSCLCPFHEDGKTPSLSVYRDKAGEWRFHCHGAGCGRHGDVVDLVMGVEGLGRDEAVERITGRRPAARGPAQPAKPPAAGAKAGPPGTFVEAYSYVDAEGRELYQVHRFRDPKTFRPDRKVRAEDRVLYHLPEVMAAPAVWVAEGEKDADNVRALGLVATTWAFGVGAWRAQYAEALKGKDVVVNLDAGYGAEAEKAARDIVKVARSVRIVELPGLVKDQDVTDWIEARDAQSAEDLRAELMRIAEGTPPFGEEYPEADVRAAANAAADEKPGDAPDAPMTLILSDVEAREVPWLWPGYIPLGRATLISGDPGSAKTWFCLDLAARLSRGRAWPDGAPGTRPARTYYMTVEDDLADTVRPRIDALGGDPSMIAAFNSEAPLHLDLADPEGLKRVEGELVRLGDVRLVVVDPIVDFSGGTNPNAGEEVRALLTPLLRLAARLNFALVIVGHLNKAQTLSAIYRAGGSTSGWLGKCRASFMIFRDVDDKALRHVIPIKANLARQDPAQLEFRIADGGLDVRVSDEEVDPDEQLNPQRGPSPKERSDAGAWIRTYFEGKDELPSVEVESAAAAAGISLATLKRAKPLVGFRSVQRREDGKTVWKWVRRSGAL